MSDKLEILDFRGRNVGGLQNTAAAKEQNIYDNLIVLFDAVNELRGTEKKKPGRPAKSWDN